MLWPTRDEFEQFALIPPVMAIDGLRLQQIVEDQSAQHRRQNVVWRPLSSASLLKPLVEVQKKSGVSFGLSFSHHRQLAEAELAVLPSALFLTPPVVGNGPRLAAELARHCELTIACDHFAQAERLNTACLSAGLTVGVLLRIDVGLGRVGVRPGPDLDELVRGILALESLRLHGLLFAAASIDASSERSPFAASAVKTVVQRSCAIMNRYELPTQTLSFSNIEDLPASPIVEGFRVEARTPLSCDEESPIAILGGVIGRPTRDQIVIDVGRQVLGEGAVVADARRNDLSLRWLGDDFSVLQLMTERHDISIGDILPLIPKNPLQLPSLAILLRDERGWCLVP